PRGGSRAYAAGRSSSSSRSQRSPPSKAVRSPTHSRPFHTHTVSSPGQRTRSPTPGVGSSGVSCTRNSGGGSTGVPPPVSLVGPRRFVKGSTAAVDAAVLCSRAARGTGERRGRGDLMGDYTEFDERPPERSGGSGFLKFCLVCGCLLVLLVVAVGGFMAYQLSQMLTTDPAKVAAKVE